jgi:hypothetical protein
MSAIAFREAYEVKAEVDDSAEALASLRFVPTEAAQRALRDHQLIFRPRPGGFALVAQFNAEAGGARRAPVRSPTALLFEIRLTDRRFFDRFHPDFDKVTGPNLYLSNRRQDGSVRLSGSLANGDTVDTDDAVRLVSRRPVLRADLTTEPPPRELKLATFFSPIEAIGDLAVNAAAGSTEAAVPVDLPSDDGSKMFTVAPSPPGGRTRRLFADDGIAARGAFGVLELIAMPDKEDREATDPPPVEHRAFFARFRSR